MPQPVEYTTRVLPSGCVEIPANVRNQLQLQPNMDVKVILSPTENQSESNMSMADDRAEVWRKLQGLRERLSGKNFSLTDALLEARREEDAAL